MKCKGCGELLKHVDEKRIRICYYCQFFGVRTITKKEE
jgi:hypothetical protein